LGEKLILMSYFLAFMNEPIEICQGGGTGLGEKIRNIFNRG